MAVGLAGQGERINQMVSDYLDREFPLSVFQRRAAQVKREAMLDEAVRAVLLTSDINHLRHQGGSVEFVAQLYASSISRQFQLLQQIAVCRLGSLRASPPLVDTATQPAGAS